MRISDWSSDVCSSDLARQRGTEPALFHRRRVVAIRATGGDAAPRSGRAEDHLPRVRTGIAGRRTRDRRRSAALDRKSVVSGKSVSVRVDLGGRRIIKKKKITTQSNRSVSEIHK